MKESMKEYLDELEKRMKEKRDNPQVDRPLEKKVEKVEENTEETDKTDEEEAKKKKE